MPRVAQTRTTKTTRATKKSKDDIASMTKISKAGGKAAAAKRKAPAKTPARKTAASSAKKEVQKLDLKPYKYVLTKVQLAQELAERSGIELKSTKAVLASLEELMQASLMPRGVGEFRMPGVLTIKTRKVAAKKGGQTKINSFTGAEYVTKAKPATVRVKAVAGSKLKVAALQ